MNWVCLEGHVAALLPISSRVVFFANVYVHQSGFRSHLESALQFRFEWMSYWIVSICARDWIGFCCCCCSFFFAFHFQLWCHRLSPFWNAVNDGVVSDGGEWWWWMAVVSNGDTVSIRASESVSTQSAHSVLIQFRSIVIIATAKLTLYT